jgi:MOSC domain-containing protein YiiM
MKQAGVISGATDMDMRDKGAGHVVSVSKADGHHFSKNVVDEITIVAGLGVEADAHQGERVKHRSRVRANPDQPNLRQVHVLHAELFEELDARGLAVGSGDLGENIVTSGIDLLNLPRGTILKLGAEAEVHVTGLRNPCSQIEAFQTGLLSALLDKGPNGEVVRKAGIMAIASVSGKVRSGDAIQIVFPPLPHARLECV